MAKFKLEDGTEVEAFTKEEMEAEVSGLKGKVDQLLGETKTEREKRQELERLQAEAEEARAKEKGEFKSLYEKTQSELEAEREQARKFRQTIQEKELDAESMKVAGMLTKDTGRAEILRKLVREHAQHTDDGVKYVVGGVEIPVEKLTEKIKTDYAFLVDGNQSSGGGAVGSGKGSGAATVGKIDGSKDERTAYIAAKYNLK